MTSETFTPSLQDVKVTLAPKAPRNRIWEIDFLRGACVVLMILDHLVMMIAQFFGPAWFGVDMAGDGGAAFCRWCAWFHESEVRTAVRTAVLFVFFSISGISCTFSRSNVKRGIVLAAVAMLYTGLSYGAENVLGISGMHVNFGVLHFYAACILFYALIEIICHRFFRDSTLAKCIASVAVIVLVVCLYYLYTPPADTPEWLAPLFPYEDAYGNPSLFYDRGEFSPGDICNLIPWSAFFFTGTAIAPLLYPRRYSLLPFMDGKWNKPVNFIGKYAIFFYMLHVIVVAALLMLISYLFVTPGDWVLM